MTRKVPDLGGSFHSIGGEFMPDRINETAAEGAGSGKAPAWSRRRLIAGAAMAGAGAAAGLSGSATLAEAGGTQGGDLVLGESNTAFATNGITTDSGTGLYGVAGEASGLETTAIAGACGDSENTFVVLGLSSDSHGVLGQTNADNYTGVLGQDVSTGGGFGVSGSSTDGVGVQAQSTSVTALQVEGGATFSRSGLVKVAAAKSAITVTGVALSASSLVLAIL